MKWKLGHSKRLSPVEYLVDENGCWIWQRWKDKDGYGKFGKGRHRRLAHRAYYERYNGEIPSGKFVLHSCDNTSCVNPEHLMVGTHEDNMRDRNRKGRQGRSPGIKNGQAKLNEMAIKEIRGMLKNGISQREVSELYGVRQGNISRIHLRKTWKHVR